MKKISYSWALLAATAWVGGMWSIGYLAAPVLFQTLEDRQLAGALAGKLFTLVANLGIACALYLLAYYFVQLGTRALRQKVVWVIASMLLLTLFGKFGIQPIMADLKVQALPLEVMHSAFAGQFRIWHGVASIIYLVQSLLGIVLILKVSVPELNEPELNEPAKSAGD